MKPLLIFISAILLSGCYQYKTQFEGPYSDAAYQVPGPLVTYEILLLENGKIQLFDRALSAQKTLDMLPNGIELASINYTHDQIAYKLPGQNITVVDSSGQYLETVPSSQDANWFDWHANNRTLYFLQYNYLFLHGPSIPLAHDNFYWLFPDDSWERSVSAVSMNDHGGLCVVVGYFIDFIGYQQKIAYIPYADPGYTIDISTTRVNWLRADSDGSAVHYGSATGEFGGSWSWNVPNQDISFNSGSDWSARSPQNDATVQVVGNLLQTTFDAGNQYNTTLNNTLVQALDW